METRSYYQYHGVTRERPRRRSEHPLSKNQSIPFTTEVFPPQAQLPAQTSQEGVLVGDISTPTQPTIPPELHRWLKLAEKEPTLLARAADNGNLTAQRAILLLAEMRSKGSI